MRRFLILLVALGLMAFATPAEAQIQSCGEGYTLFIRNPDIIPDSSGTFHVSGHLLVQFQVIGPNADNIEAFGLSFGADLPTGEEFCALPSAAWLTGAYIESYSLDKTKEDGFFIGINSNGDTSPQYDLGVAVHGYDAQNNEVARFWGIVSIDHCGSQPQLGCPGDPNAPDFTMPWPILLPGDGAVRPEPNGFVFEFNEELSDLSVTLNAEDVTDELEEWTDRPVWDRDSAPGGPQLLFERVAPQCSLEGPTQGNVHSCGPLGGPAYKWTGRAVTDADVIRIVATDLAGNVATKEIHIGSSVAGGTISDGVPILQWNFEPTGGLDLAPGDTGVFTVTLENNGGGEGHPFADALVPDGWSHQWVPGHQPVPAGGESRQELHVTVPANASAGAYIVEPEVNYQQGSQEKTLRSVLNVRVAVPEGTSVQPSEEGEGKKSPAPAPLVGLVLLGALAVARRR